MIEKDKITIITHEPEHPLPGFPESHVKVDDVFAEDHAECVRITIHGAEHYLHRTTALALFEQLYGYFQNLSAAEKELLLQFDLERTGECSDNAPESNDERNL